MEYINGEDVHSLIEAPDNVKNAYRLLTKAEALRDKLQLEITVNGVCIQAMHNVIQSHLGIGVVQDENP